MTYAEGAKSGEVAFKPKLSLSVGEEVEKDSLNCETHKFTTNNQLILLFLEKLCRYSATISCEDLESAVLVTTTPGKDDLPTVETLRSAYRTLGEICDDLSSSIDKDLTKEKLYLFKATPFSIKSCCIVRYRMLFGREGRGVTHLSLAPK